MKYLIIVFWMAAAINFAIWMKSSAAGFSLFFVLVSLDLSLKESR
jgi:hypothetical protein